MKTVALYARVSTEHQAQDATIESQVCALRERARADGHQVLPGDVYVDEGFSGTTLVRPALERLRDRIAEHVIDIVYIHHPDRLARRYAYQVLLLEEFAAHGAAVVFLQGATSNNPEDALLVQVQGMLAEYERARLVERGRRGKLHKARQGAVSPFSSAPYGYLYVRKSETEPARFEVLPDEAKVVGRIFDALVHEQKSINEIARSLDANRIPTPGRSSRWSPSTVWAILNNPAYTGLAAYGKTAVTERRPRLRPTRHANPTPRRAKCARVCTPPEQWIRIPVPAIVSAEVFAAVREQMERNLRLVRHQARGQRYLLQGLLVCARCGYAFYGMTVKHRRGYEHSYYRCIGTDAHRFAGTRVCTNPPVRADTLDDYVWESVQQVLQDPERMLQEWTRRADTDSTQVEQRLQRDRATAEVARYERNLKRLLDAYEAEAIELEELTLRSNRVKAQLQHAHQSLNEAEDRLHQTVTLRAITTRLEDFAERVKQGLERLDWNERRHLIRTLVAKVEIDDEGATVIYRLPPTGSPQGGGSSQPDSSGRGPPEGYGLRPRGVGRCFHQLVLRLHGVRARSRGGGQPAVAPTWNGTRIGKRAGDGKGKAAKGPTMSTCHCADFTSAPFGGTAAF
jgi:site-specific DNA recombinase